MRQDEKLMSLLADGEWHKTPEIAEYLGLKESRTKEIMKRLVDTNKVQDNGKYSKGKMYKLK